MNDYERIIVEHLASYDRPVSWYDSYSHFCKHVCLKNEGASAFRTDIFRETLAQLVEAGVVAHFYVDTPSDHGKSQVLHLSVVCPLHKLAAQSE